MIDMGWLRSLLSPLKKLWIRLHSARRQRRGIYMLYEDVKSCPYEDVQILWSIVAESRPPAAAAAAASAAAFGLGEVGGAERGEGGMIRF
ncbi:hypothetical protein MUK42_10656 [Musa troglodytarum]|uniref:Uncharacterized protein n=1 Tax=Musa troglodytarum TaxID=320322 RepID=A0A9E7GLD1_9LILI|nr:hypothetical protein MUK42_10656 [Musa troglodytarum]